MANNARTRDNMVGMAYLKKTPSDNPKAPKVKGFISITPELAKVLSNLEPDSYGTVKLEISLWTNEEQPGVLKGTAQLPYEVRQGRTTAPAPRQVSDDDLAF